MQQGVDATGLEGARTTSVNSAPEHFESVLADCWVLHADAGSSLVLEILRHSYSQGHEKGP